MRKLGRIFKALSDETRLTIMALVLKHERLCVCEAEQILDISQSKASRHMRYLRNAGLLEDQRDGLIVNYRLPESPDDEATVMLAFLEKLLARRPVPEAGPVLTQIRAGRADGSAASTVMRAARAEERSTSA